LLFFNDLLFPLPAQGYKQGSNGVMHDFSKDSLTYEGSSD